MSNFTKKQRRAKRLAHQKEKEVATRAVWFMKGAALAHKGATLEECAKWIHWKNIEFATGEDMPMEELTERKCPGCGDAFVPTEKSDQVVCSPACLQFMNTEAK